MAVGWYNSNKQVAFSVSRHKEKGWRKAFWDSKNCFSVFSVTLSKVALFTYEKKRGDKIKSIITDYVPCMVSSRLSADVLGVIVTC